MNVLPKWNSPGTYSMGRDPLGLQAASVRLYTRLVPGITNVTNRIRYYSFYCWVIREFEQLEYSDDEAKWKRFIRRAEAAYALSCVTYDPDNAGGMAGSDWGRKHTADITEDGFEFSPWSDQPGENNQYLKAPRGNFGQFYISSMIDVGMLVPNNSRIPLLTENYGVLIAQAFEDACPGACSSLRDAISSGKITKAQAKIISKEASPGVMLDSTERQHLKDFLLGLREDDTTGKIRRESLWNCLWSFELIESWKINDIRSIFYQQQHEGSPLPKKHKGNLDLWRAYHANELCHVAMELLLNELSHEIDEHFEGVEPKQIIWLVLKRILEDPISSGATLENFSDKLAVSTTLAQDCQKGELILESLASPYDRPPKETVRTAIQLICVLYSRWKNEPIINSALSPAENFGRSLAAIMQYMENVQRLPVAEALYSLIRKFVISNHLHIAGQKLANSGTFTYRFLSEDGMLRDVRLTDYNFTTPRLFNLLWFAEDLGLIANERLTKAGKEFLRGT